MHDDKFDERHCCCRDTVWYYFGLLSGEVWKMRMRLTAAIKGQIIPAAKDRIMCSNYCSHCGRADCDFIRDCLNRLAAYEDTGLTPEDVQVVSTSESCREYVEWKKAASEGRLIVLPAPARKGEPKPKCYSEKLFCEGLCNGYSSGYDDEPTEHCKNCWYCKFSYARLEEAEKAQEG